MSRNYWSGSCRTCSTGPGYPITGNKMTDLIYYWGCQLPLTHNNKMEQGISTAVFFVCFVSKFTVLTMCGMFFFPSWGSRRLLSAVCGGHTGWCPATGCRRRSGEKVWRHRHLGQQCQCHQSYRNPGHNNEEVRWVLYVKAFRWSRFNSSTKHKCERLISFELAIVSRCWEWLLVFSEVQ